MTQISPFRGSGFTVLKFVPTLVFALVVELGCSSPDLSGPVSVDPATLAWTMSLSAHAITMSSDTASHADTLQLTAVPQTVTGVPLPNAPAVTFTTSDSSLRVSSTGLLTARQPQLGVRVFATVIYQGIRLTDTAIVNITPLHARPPFQQLQLQPRFGENDSIPAPNFWGVAAQVSTGRRTLQVGVLDVTGAQIDGSVVALRVSDVLQAELYERDGEERVTTTGRTFNVKVGMSSRIGGPVTVYATATVYGVPLQDSLQLHVIDPAVFIYTITKSTPTGSSTPTWTVGPPTQPISVGGYVWWVNQSSSEDSMDVVFDDPTAASEDGAVWTSGEGNMTAFGGSCGLYCNDDVTPSIRSRQFLRAGAFHWRSPRTGVSGTVVVR